MRPGSRRRRLLTRAAPVGGIAAIAFAAGLVYATERGGTERRLANRYVTAWVDGDFTRMYGLLDQATRSRLTESQFADAYQKAATTATIQSVSLVRVGNLTNDYVPVRVKVKTTVFGTIRGTIDVPITEGDSDTTVHFTNALLFPGLHAGQQLTRQTRLAPRATLLADNGVPLAQGPSRSSPIPAVANQIVGTLGPIPSALASVYAAEGYPPNAKVGINGLEHIFQQQVAGIPGGKLLAGSRVLASTEPTTGLAVKTTINPTLEQAATAAMGQNLAGIVAMDPRTGALLALAGIAFSDLQPPGSTFKMVTVTAALNAGIVTPSSTFPDATSALIDGFNLQNANGESCGGTLVNAFAVSCNSVFAPLGARLGGAALVSMAERFGFNQPTTIPGAAVSQIPSAGTIGDSLAVASSAIGQGDVLASPLEMTDIGATIAMGGRRPIPTLQFGAKPQFVHVVSGTIAHEVRQMMIAVVEYGTGTAAQIPGVTVAGKTGTAELVSTQQPGSSSTNTNADTDAWFVGFVPADAPKIVVGALFPQNGAGGATAAPAVRQVLVTALQH